MTNFVTMATRVATELRRANMLDEIKRSINDAIFEAATTRFYFNEMRALTFNTVPGQEYYPDMNITEIDPYGIYWIDGAARRNLYLDSADQADRRASGNIVNGTLTNYSRRGQELRLYPIPTVVTAVIMNGYGRLLPYPLVEESDANAWMTEGERYIRTLAKRNIQRDVVRDYPDALVWEAIAEDYRTQLLDATTQRLGTGVLHPTKF